MKDYITSLFKTLPDEINCLRGFKITSYPDSVNNRREYREKAENIYDNLVQVLLTNVPICYDIVDIETFSSIIKAVANEDYLKEILYVQHMQDRLTLFKHIQSTLLDESTIHEVLTSLQAGKEYRGAVCEVIQFRIVSNCVFTSIGSLVFKTFMEGKGLTTVSRLRFLISTKFQSREKALAEETQASRERMKEL